MQITLTDHTEDGDPIAVVCEYEMDCGEAETNCAGGYNITWIKYGNTQYSCLEDLKEDYPDCAQELESLLDVAYDEWYEETEHRRFYKEYERFDD